MKNRYASRPLLLNDAEEYDHLLEKRGLKSIVQYGSGVLRYPTVEEIRNLTQVRHAWSSGDRFYKLAAQHYGNPEYWWVIAHYNQKPTEANVSLGDMIRIPLPLEKILTYIME